MYRRCDLRACARSYFSRVKGGRAKQPARTDLFRARAAICAIGDLSANLSWGRSMRSLLASAMVSARHLVAFVRLGRPLFSVGGFALYGLGAAAAAWSTGHAIAWGRFAL